MYEDKLDGRIANGYFDSEAAEMRAAQAAIMRELEAHQTANRSYIEEGVQLLELAHRCGRPVRESAASGETQTPELSYSRTALGKAANSPQNIDNRLMCWQLRSRRNSSGWERDRRKRPNMRYGSPQNLVSNGLSWAQVIENKRRIGGDERGTDDSHSTAA